VPDPLPKPSPHACMAKHTAQACLSSLQRNAAAPCLPRRLQARMLAPPPPVSSSTCQFILLANRFLGGTPSSRAMGRHSSRKPPLCGAGGGEAAQPSEYQYEGALCLRGRIEYTGKIFACMARRTRAPTPPGQPDKVDGHPARLQLRYEVLGALRSPGGEQSGCRASLPNRHQEWVLGADATAPNSCGEGRRLQGAPG
jgi:hypothetical protein